MVKLRKKIYMVAGYNTISMGTGRKEFNPKKERAGLEELMKEAGQGVLKQIGGAKNVDEAVIGNFIAARFNRQANLAAFLPFIDEGLKYKPCVRVEGACGTGALALVTGIKSVLAETADVVLVLGVEVQNTVKAIYGADILAAAGWAKERKNGHAYFFQGKFSDRAKAYVEKFGKEKSRKAMAKWFTNAIENARTCPTAQEYHNFTKDITACGMMEPNPKGFVDSLNVFDCSKVSDGASALVIVSEEGLKRIGIPKSKAIEVIGFGQASEDITKAPVDPTKLSTTAEAVRKALESAGITKDQIGTVECHDCFTIAGIMAVEAIGFAEHGKGIDFVIEGNTAHDGIVPFNTTGGLIGSGSMSPEALKEHIIKCKASTNKPFGVNVPLLYHNTNEIFNLIIDEGVKIVFTSAGSPAKFTPFLKEKGVTVVHVIANSKFARKSEEAGVDAIVAEGFEAGGHNGKEETTTLVLIPMIREQVSLPLIAAGGIGTGRGMLAALALGADGVQIGSRFVASSESSAHENFKNKILETKEGDTMLSMKSLAPVRLIKNKFYYDLEKLENNGATPNQIADLLGKGRAKLGMFDGDVEEGEIEIGQIAGIINEIKPVSVIMENIIKEFTFAKKEMENFNL